MEAYAEDLAYVHDAGFTAFARDAAPWLLEQLREHGAGPGRVVDLGCGSGVWAERLVGAGFDVLGVDVSPAMIELARRRVPGYPLAGRAEFRVESCLDVVLPSCVGVTATSECLNYLFDPRLGEATLPELFRRIYAALAPGGLFFLDVATPGRERRAGPQKRHTLGDDWAVLVTAEEDQAAGTLTRDITTFRRVGEGYRRSHEVHRLRLYRTAELAEQLRAAGFRVRSLRGYGELRFPRGYAGFLARKPAAAGR